MGKQQTKRKNYHIVIGVTALIFIVGTLFGYSSAGNVNPFADYNLFPIELLGKYIYFDEISDPPRQGCSTCHNPRAGWRFGVAGTNLHNVAITGANPLTVGSLNPPSNAYAPQESFFDDCPFGVPGLCGGNFWNGRAEGNSISLASATPHVGIEVALDRSGTDGISYVPELLAYFNTYEGPIADQAFNPFLNPVEQGNLDEQAVCQQVESSQYAKLFEIVWLEPIDCNNAPGYGGSTFSAAQINHRRIALSLAAWQMSSQVNSFSCKRDIALTRELDGIDIDDTPGEFPLVGFTDQENLGHDLFYNTPPFPFLPVGAIPVGPTVVQNFPPNPNLPAANCSFCHSDNPGVFIPFNTDPIIPPDTGVEPLQLYTDTAYHNIGVPVNTEIPDTGIDPDEGLAGHTGDSNHLGFFKTATLRNVCKGTGEGFIKTFTHNGWFKSVESIVHFYNTANIDGATAATFGVTACPEGVVTEKDALKNNCWPAAAYPDSPGTARGTPILGDLGLTAEQEAAIVAYLHTLSDTYTPQAPMPYNGLSRRPRR